MGDEKLVINVSSISWPKSGAVDPHFFIRSVGGRCVILSVGACWRLGAVAANTCAFPFPGPVAAGQLRDG